MAGLFIYAPLWFRNKAERAERDQTLQKSLSVLLLESALKPRNYSILIKNNISECLYKTALSLEHSLLTGEDRSPCLAVNNSGDLTLCFSFWWWNHERGRNEGACSQRWTFTLLADMKSARCQLSPHTGHLTRPTALRSAALGGGTAGGRTPPGPRKEFSLGLLLPKTGTLLWKTGQWWPR